MLKRIWNLLCSLKLTIWLATLATVLTMGGSIVMIKFPKTFGPIDQMTLVEWFGRFGAPNPLKSWWLALVGLLVFLLGLNTLCCFVDWLPKFRQRWRKSGEYLIHLGFVLLAISFAWGSVAGSRSEENRLRVGATHPLDAVAPGYSVRLEKFEPEFGPEGRPNDMVSTLTLMKQGAVVRTETIRLNHPLIENGLVILPASFDREAEGFRFALPDGRSVELRNGSVARIGDRQGALRVVTFAPDVVRGGDGRVATRSGDLINPGFELELVVPGREPWRGWYLLREGVPAPLIEAGLLLKPIEPVTGWVSILTINRDPGVGVAEAGAYCMGIGVVFALASFYYKRSRGDRPDVI